MGFSEPLVVTYSITNRLSSLKSGIFLPQGVTETILFFLWAAYIFFYLQLLKAPKCWRESNEIQFWKSIDYCITNTKRYRVYMSTHTQIVPEERALGFSWLGMCVCMHRILISWSFITIISYCALAVARGTDLFSNALGLVLYID